jgi:hypothetical protein
MLISGPLCLGTAGDTGTTFSHTPREHQVVFVPIGRRRRRARSAAKFVVCSCSNTPPRVRVPSLVSAAANGIDDGEGQAVGRLRGISAMGV